jgi:hypothetical protein
VTLIGRSATDRLLGTGRPRGESVHALATQRGIKDTSAAGDRYHNKCFVAQAAELGLPARAPPHPAHTKQIEDGPITCGPCCAPFEPPDHDAKPEDDR